ncbi:hypothetical protein OAS39_01220, partial [Pirellulales bacterium]|nr:hypothetical protein [Pirellulales bacterium]
MLADDFVPVATGGRAELDAPAPRVHLLDNGRLVSMITAAGGGYVQFDERALTRWRPDATRDADGCFLYLRDLDDGDFWSAGFQPTALEPAAYNVEFAPGLVRIVRSDREIQTAVDLCVAP